jgi:hypothetical protein
VKGRTHRGEGSLAPVRRGVVAARPKFRSRPARPCQWPGSRVIQDAKSPNGPPASDWKRCRIWSASNDRPVVANLSTIAPPFPAPSCRPVSTASALPAALRGPDEETKRDRTSVGFGESTLPARPSIRAMRRETHSGGPCQRPGSRLANGKRDDPASGRRLRALRRARVIYQPYAVGVTLDRLSLGDRRLTPARAARALGTRYRLRAGYAALLSGRPATASLVVALLAFALSLLRLTAGYSAAATATVNGSRSQPNRSARRAALGRNRAAAESRCSAASVSLAPTGGGRR